MLLLLLACNGTFHSELGNDAVRTALWFDVNALEGVTNPAVPRENLLLLLNSTVPCRAPEVRNDASTPEVDEAAAAVQYWQAQVYTAFVREGALAVAMGLYTFEPAWDGRYAFHAEAFTAAPDLLQSETRVAFGAWYRVDEAVLDEANGVFYTYTPTDVQYSPAVDTPAWVNIDAHEDGVFSGNFSFTPTELSGTFRAEPCDNRELLDALLAQVVQLQYLDGGGVIFGR
jgi:hypothetical protein